MFKIISKKIILTPEADIVIQLHLPANLLMAILAIIGSALAGSLQPTLAIAVLTTVGLTALTRI